MIVREPWWVFPRAANAATCQRIVERGLEARREVGTVRTGNNDGSTRSSTVAWLEDEWIYDLVFPLVEKANRSAGWNFDLERMLPLQFTTYEPGGHYDWHFDDRSGRVYGEDDGSLPEFHGLLRKVSFSLILSAGDSHDGGDLEIELGLPTNPERIEQPNPGRELGTMVVFPSFMPHRVTPVTRGVRYSLVGWTCGPPWR